MHSKASYLKCMPNSKYSGSLHWDLPAKPRLLSCRLDLIQPEVSEDLLPGHFRSSSQTGIS